VANHRAPKRGVLRRRSLFRVVGPGSKRKGQHASSTHAGSRKTLISGILSGPTLVGAAAIALAAVGAVTVSSAEGASAIASGEVRKLSAEASALTGAGSNGSAHLLTGRARAISRDSRRDALKGAADERLQAMAERQAKRRKAALADVAGSATFLPPHGAIRSVLRAVVALPHRSRLRGSERDADSRGRER
jgi:hypothetical protein